MKSRADIPITRDTVLQFGKHKGWTIGDCVEADPSYVIWLSEDEVMKIPDDILDKKIGMHNLIHLMIGMVEKVLLIGMTKTLITFSGTYFPSGL